MSSTYAKKFSIPDGFHAEMWGLAQEVLRASTAGELDANSREQLYRFSHEHFSRVLAAREEEAMALHDAEAGVLEADDEALEN